MFETLKDRESHWKSQFFEVKDYQIPKNHHALTDLVLKSSSTYENLIFYMNNSPVQFTYHAESGYFTEIPATEIIKVWETENVLSAASKITFYNCAQFFKLTEEDALFLLNWAYQEDKHFLTGGISPDDRITSTPHFYDFKNKNSSDYKEYISRMRKVAPYNRAIQEVLKATQETDGYKEIDFSTVGGQYAVSYFILHGKHFTSNSVLKSVFNQVAAQSNVIQGYQNYYFYSSLLKKLAISDLVDKNTRQKYVDILEQYYYANKKNKNTAALIVHGLSFSQCSETELSRYLEITEMLWKEAGSVNTVITTMKETKQGGKFFPKYIVENYGEDFTAESSDGILLPNNNFSERLNLYLKITTLSSLMTPNERELLSNELENFFITHTGLSAPSSLNQSASILKTLLN